MNNGGEMPHGKIDFQRQEAPTEEIDWRTWLNKFGWPDISTSQYLDKLLKLFEIKETNDYGAVVITGSGTAANESILSSVVGDKNIIIL